MGPSITYKLRDAAGQAKEFHNYMLPVKMGDADTDIPAMLMGVRENPVDGFRYLRIPADEKGIGGFLCVFAQHWLTKIRELAAQRYAKIG